MLVSAALVALVARTVNWASLGRLVGRADLWWAALGTALVPVVIAGLALRWLIFLRQQGLPVPLATIFQLTWAGQFFNSVLPGSTGGDVVKIFQLCRTFPARKAAAAATIVADRLIALLALMAMALLSLIIDPVPVRILSQQRMSVSAAALWLVAIVLLAAGALWLVSRMGRFTQVTRRISRTVQAMRMHLGLNRYLAAALALALAVHCVNFFSFYCFARSLSLALTYTQVVTMMPVLLFFMLLPITINGHGLRELLLIVYFAHMGTSVATSGQAGVQEMAVAVSLLGVASDLLWSLPGGLLYLLRFGGAKATAPPAVGGEV